MFCEYMCACVLMYLNIRGLYQVPSSIAFHLIFWGGQELSLNLNSLIGYTNCQEIPGIGLSRPPQHWDYSCTPPHLALNI